jgi:hypothetical protein
MRAWYWVLTGAMFCLLAFTPALRAQEVIVYPAKGQGNDQMEQDKFQCYSWAKQQSGFDPMAPPTTSTPPPAKNAPQGGVLRGAARGAVVGGVGGAILGDTKKGLALGAASGGLLGGMRRSDQRRQEEQAQKQWEQQQVQQYSQSRNTYNRAYAACLEGKGYTVK